MIERGSPFPLNGGSWRQRSRAPAASRRARPGRHRAQPALRCRSPPQNDTVSTTAPGADETVSPAFDTTSAPPPTVEPVASIAPLAPGRSVTAGGAPGTRSTPSVPSPTTGIEPRPFAVSGVIIRTLVTTVITPPKRQINARYRNTVTIQAPTGLAIGFSSAFVFPSSESVWYFLPVKIGRTKHIKNWINNAHEARYMPS